MNDDEIEKHLRRLPAPDLPESWRAEILAHARREGPEPESARRFWPPLFIALRNLFARNPVTTSVLAALWILILFFRFDTPVDPVEENLLAHMDRSQPVYFVSMADEIHLVETLQEKPDQPGRIP